MKKTTGQAEAIGDIASADPTAEGCTLEQLEIAQLQLVGRIQDIDRQFSEFNDLKQTTRMPNSEYRDMLAWRKAATKAKNALTAKKRAVDLAIKKRRMEQAAPDQHLRRLLARAGDILRTIEPRDAETSILLADIEAMYVAEQRLAGTSPHQTYHIGPIDRVPDKVVA